MRRTPLLPALLAGLLHCAQPFAAHPPLLGATLRAGGGTAMSAAAERAAARSTSAERAAARSVSEEADQVGLAAGADLPDTVPEKLVGDLGRLLGGSIDPEVEGNQEGQINNAIRRLQRDMESLDNQMGAAPQLTTFELGLLSSTVAIAFGAPWFLGTKLVEVLVPTMAALSAATGLSAEYVGRVAVSRGKEIAATTLQAAAEAEQTLAQAERAKAIIPLCVGVAATSSAFALLAPALLEEVTGRFGVILITEIYLVSPLFAVLGAAVAALAEQESSALSARASDIGLRRFATRTDVGRTWLSATEQISASSARSQQKWLSFVTGVVPAPLVAAIVPGPLSFKAIVAAAFAAAQAAYSLARCEYSLATATEAVALKSRSAAISDTYANQGARAGAILPFTSALSGLCAACTVAIVEALPLIGSVGAQVHPTPPLALLPAAPLPMFVY